MSTTTNAPTDVSTIAPIDHDEAATLAATETQRILDLATSLTAASASTASASTICGTPATPSRPRRARAPGS